ncbi:hypothetical protein [Massilia sp. Se16.2.3]|nr:hypothetical protein [Massilia sp. Se16.2.3]QNB00094.1 hypothetical protein G4G31_16830 [Massilia sp. Se16.2.3]
MFCFDGRLFEGWNDRSAWVPDCFVIGVSDWINPKLWVLGNLAVAVALSVWAYATAYGLFRSRSWCGAVALGGSLFGMAYFAQLALALPEFRTESIVGMSALACFATGCLVARGVPARA